MRPIYSVGRVRGSFHLIDEGKFQKYQKYYLGAVSLINFSAEGKLISYLLSRESRVKIVLLKRK